MLRDAGVRGKLFAVLAIPMLLLVVATGWLVGGQVQTARQAGKIEAVTDVAIQLNRVVHSLQLERSDTLGFLQDPTASHRSAMQSQRADTDAELVVLREKVVDSPIPDMSVSIQAAATRTAVAHSELVSARKSVDTGRFFATETDVFYGKIIATDLQLPGSIASAATAELAQRLQAEEALSTTIESASHERDLVQLAYLSGSVNEAEFGQASALAAQQRQSLQDFQRSAPAALFDALDTKLADADVTELDIARRHLTDLLKGRAPDRSGSVAWIKAANPRIASMVTTEGQLVNDIGTVAASLQSAEQLKAGTFGAGAIFGLVLAVLFAAVLAQRITLPLRRLTVAAGEIGEELPRMVERMQQPGEGPGVVVEPIAVESDDEIGRLAAAFNTVNEVTLRVAQEQAALRANIAEMFVNVARRNQVLLGRQLAQLDKMEAREEDPDLLKNLFGLDHLATRMRRNAESLLVLAGIDSTRRLRQSMPLSDVINAALQEIEAYERIDEPSMADDPPVSGRHALSIAHLLAELLENATVFSNPGTRVVVAAAMTGHGVDVTITDYGLGMSDEEIASANESIAHPPLAEIAVSQRLGLFVVGRIAARIGATATLRQGRSAGTVVTVGLPFDVFEGLQVDEPANGPAVADSVAPTAAADARPDESAYDTAVADLGTLVGAVPFAGSGVAAAVEAPTPAVARFNPSNVALSRLPQVDVAALMADAEVDRLTHAIAAPLTAEGAGRRLLPRRSRSDEPVVEPGAGEPVGEPAALDAPVADVEEPSLAVAEVPGAEVPVADVPVAEPVSEVPDVEPPAVVEAADDVPLEVASSARRRGSFFARRRDEAPSEATEPVKAVVKVEPPRRGGLFGRRQSTADERLVAIETRLEKPVEAPVEAMPDAAVDNGLFTPIFEPTRADDEPFTPTFAPAADVAVVPVADVADAEPPIEPVLAEPVAEQPVAVEPVAAEPTPRRGLFGRRPNVVAEPVADEVVAEPAAAGPVEVEAVTETVPEPIDVEAMLAPVAEIRVPEPFAWPVTDEATDVESVERPTTEASADDAVADEPVAEQRVEIVDKPTRRRGLFGRRQRHDQRVADEPAAEAIQDSVADMFTPAVDAPAADFQRDSFAAHLPEPVVELAPAPAAPLYLASAIDILPGKPLGRRGKHGKPAPVAPVAPVAASLAPPAPPVAIATAAPTAPEALTAPATTYAAPPASAPVFAPSPFAQPVDDEPVRVPAAAVPSMPQRAPQSTAPTAPPREASAPVPTPESQPAASAPMTELDQLALNAELQKSALSELRGLYEPANQAAAPVADAAAGLIRRQRRAVEAVAETETSDLPARTRNPAEVRGMLSGFRAGVERGRSAPQTATDASSYGDVVVDNAPPTDPANGAPDATDESTD